MKISDVESRLTERQKSLLSHWKASAGGGHCPRRKDIDPGKVLNALSTVSIVETTHDGFRFRLTGSRLRHLFGGDVQGQLISAIDAEVEEAGSASMELAIETGRPIHGNRRRDGRWHFWLRLPLRDDNGQVSLVLCADELCDREDGASVRCGEADTRTIKTLAA
ncbi:MAG: PAS domain-containing protein [Pseudomonadota bacterium]